MSAATMRGSGSKGNNNSNTDTSMAPAPTEVSVTSAPMTAPSSVTSQVWRARLACASVSSASWRGCCLPRTTLNSKAAAVSSRAIPRLCVVSPCTRSLAGPKWCSTAKVKRAAGRLPALSCATTRQANGAAELGEGGKEQVGTDGQVGFDAEEKDQDGRHQRATANAGQPHGESHSEAGEDDGQIGHAANCRESWLF